jgi:hypothetical protein
MSRDSRWTTKDKRKVKIKDLEIEHIFNIIKHLKQYGYISLVDEYTIFFANPNGDVAQLHLENERNRLYYKVGCIWIDVLENELEYRSKIGLINITNDEITSIGTV